MKYRINLKILMQNVARAKKAKYFLAMFRE